MSIKLVIRDCVTDSHQSNAYFSEMRITNTQKIVSAKYAQYEICASLVQKKGTNISHCVRSSTRWRHPLLL